MPSPLSAGENVKRKIPSVLSSAFSGDIEVSFHRIFSLTRSLTHSRRRSKLDNGCASSSFSSFSVFHKGSVRLDSSGGSFRHTMGLLACFSRSRLMKYCRP
ncbi:hypothetical protein E2C01_046930 [Portunus trituberculatus]|uniref:Uncharacterized protein n=1 Tax=Portunus trituberculatus TaxID=210409 RepID=A0A5B7G6D5_PORTR|nr:hypothetical protein [Portunus trituberculatus]